MKAAEPPKGTFPAGWETSGPASGMRVSENKGGSETGLRPLRMGRSAKGGGMTGWRAACPATTCAPTASSWTFRTTMPTRASRSLCSQSPKTWLGRTLSWVQCPQALPRTASTGNADRAQRECWHGRGRPQAGAGPVAGDLGPIRGPGRAVNPARPWVRVQICTPRCRGRGMLTVAPPRALQPGRWPSCGASSVTRVSTARWARWSAVSRSTTGSPDAHATFGCTKVARQTRMGWRPASACA